MTSASISEQLRKIIDDLTSAETRRKIFARAARELRDVAAIYPPEGDWNSPSRSRWYQRHFGARWRRRDGTIGGRNTSERLQKSWQAESSYEDAAAFTSVTYAPFLIDDKRRARWAKSHGWRSATEILEGFVAQFEKIVLEEIEKK